MPRVTTGILDIEYARGGPAGAPAILMLHGWPDDVRGWSGVAPLLHAAGFQTIAPYLRGCGGTRFLESRTPRDGRAVALAQDAIDLANALEIAQFTVLGHDWGARAAYTLAVLFPERVPRIAALSLAYQPRGTFRLPAFSQAHQLWYQWFMTLDQGADAVRRDPVGFARTQWEKWSPPGWFADAEFERTAESFANPDWTAVTLHAYRSRWRTEAGDPRYDHLQARLQTLEKLDTPTLMIQGAADECAAPQNSEGLEGWFSNGYQRILLDKVGHFPAREAPEAVASAVIAFFQRGSLDR